MDGRNVYTSEKMYRTHANAQFVPGKKPTVKRGGQYVVGKPYVVKGKRYFPKEDPSYDRSGIASWYGSAFEGRRTANGETYDSDHLSAAHATLPLPSYVRVTNLENGSSVIVRVNDRGPYHNGRLIDLSSKAADMLDLKHRGIASVRVQYVGRPGLGGNDMAFLLASHVKKGRNTPIFDRKAQVTTDAQVASRQATNNHWSSNNQPLGSRHWAFAGRVRDASYHAPPGASDTIKTLARRVQREDESMTIKASLAYAAIIPTDLRAPEERRGGRVDRVHMPAVVLMRAQPARGCQSVPNDGDGRCGLQTSSLLAFDRERRATGAIGARRHLQGRGRRRWGFPWSST
ncbi:MAG TPA: septal ring lytic transglycosylase RlpA family protein [Ensifer sp.]|nr:septal ring lytic transglycosylase RlpA family protein [Ensifer sp.]